jgi:hypothetical protein
MTAKASHLGRAVVAELLQRSGGHTPEIVSGPLAPLTPIFMSFSDTNKQI